ncbi:unnamed protein product [Meganyctiphanes norvegica]|uniref:Zinc finger PHD-type domain-containing protein n=1 Tax=Meganyctiphanes norvegica TaxID=48144 RepID=A0AAV2QPB5_MEGNR
MFGSTKKMNINQTTYAMAAVSAKSAVFRTTKSTKKITKSLPKISNTFPSSSPDTGLVSNEIFPCAICNIANHTKGITCFVCNRYFHVKCEGGFNKEMYTFYTKYYSRFECKECHTLAFTSSFRDVRRKLADTGDALNLNVSSHEQNVSDTEQIIVDNKKISIRLSMSQSMLTVHFY